ncbi:hypothetical protein OIU77_025884 [Salix suchowensis]|uniref:Uncharacterized protein n=1 Tax=Salix suchowensis TaxID=1278906 RepID=A0ABQ9BXS3_9ROSI|nr:hypothetical protein OIU77_025884 [Salix suchowensis]
MLRNRSRAVTSKQNLMADHSSTQSTSNQNCTQPASFLVSPRFKAFTFKGLPVAEPMMSPSSILDTTKQFFPFKNPFSYVINQPKSPKKFSQSANTRGTNQTQRVLVLRLLMIHQTVAKYPSKRMKTIFLNPVTERSCLAPTTEFKSHHSQTLYYFQLSHLNLQASLEF